MKRVIIFLLILVSGKSWSQSKPLGSWYVYNGFYRFSPKTELFIETQLRSWEVVSNPQNILLKPYISYFFNSSFQIGISQEYHYSWTYAENKDDRTTFEEYRTGLQAIFAHKIFKNTVLQHRLRYEFRFLDEKGKQRTRYRLQASILFNKGDKKLGYWFSTIGNEFMFNTAPELEVDQNRLYGMIGYQFSKQTNFQVGYMHLSYPEEENLSRLMFFLTHKLKTYKSD